MSRQRTETALEQLLTVREFARIFRRHPQTVYRRIRLGTFRRFPVERDGRSLLIRVPTSAIERLTY